MNYLLINSSPRGRESNSALILSLMKEGLLRGGAEESDIDMIDLRSALRTQSWKTSVEKAGLVIIAFPLYADFVPGILKKFIEDLGPDGLEGKTLAWVSQCGFPDSIHLELVEMYLVKTTTRLGARPGGIIKKAGVEGIRLMPPSMTKKLFESFRIFGEDLAKNGYFDVGRAENLALPRLFSPAGRVFNRILNATGMSNFYWNKMLKENGAYDRRFDQPYAP